MKPNKTTSTFTALFAIPHTAAPIEPVAYESVDLASYEQCALDTTEASDVTEANVEVPAVVEISDPNSSFEVAFNAGSTWEAETEKRFHRLAIKEAASTITGSEKRELEELDRLRSETLVKYSADEVLERYRRDKASSEVLKILKRYVRLVPAK